MDINEMDIEVDGRSLRLATGLGAAVIVLGFIQIVLSIILVALFFRGDGNALDIILACWAGISVLQVLCWATSRYMFTRFVRQGRAHKTDQQTPSE